MKALAFCLALVACLGQAHAADDPPRGDARHRAKQLFEQGKRLFELGDYPKAAETFLEAYRTKPAPLFFFNIGISYQRAGDLEKAKSFFMKFIDAAPNAPQRGEAMRALGEIEIQLREQQSKNPPPPAPAPAPVVTPAPNPVVVQTPTVTKSKGPTEQQKKRRLALGLGLGLGGAVLIIAVGLGLGLGLAPDTSPPDTSHDNYCPFCR